MGDLERLGVLGGTFDPPHVAHVALARAARDGAALDRVLLVVARDPWQKRDEVEASAPDRMAMVEAAVAGEARIDACDVELRRPGPTYTADTLRELATPGRSLFVVVGADVAASVDTWHQPDQVRELATLLVAARPEPPDTPALAVVGELRGRGWRCDELDAPLLDVSSTEVRDRLHRGEPVDDLVPPGVVHVIEERGLYTRPR